MIFETEVKTVILKIVFIKLNLDTLRLSRVQSCFVRNIPIPLIELSSGRVSLNFY